MKLRTAAIVAVSALVVVAGLLGARGMLREEPGEPVTVAQGEVEVRVAGPGTVQARVPVTVSARLSAQVVSLHADHGDLVKRPLAKFFATILGVGMLLAIVLVMNGIYRGNILDGIWLIDNTAADLWVVEHGRGGPFNESSRMPADEHRNVAAAPGVARASPFIAYAAQREIAGTSQQFTIVGYDMFGGLGGPGRLVAGRGIEGFDSVYQMNDGRLARER